MFVGILLRDLARDFRVEFESSCHHMIFEISSRTVKKLKGALPYRLSKVGEKLIFLGNVAPKDTRKLYIKDDFIQELIELWTDLNYRDSFASQANFSAGHKLFPIT